MAGDTRGQKKILYTSWGFGFWRKTNITNGQTNPLLLYQNSNLSLLIMEKNGKIRYLWKWVTKKNSKLGRKNPKEQGINHGINVINHIANNTQFTLDYGYQSSSYTFILSTTCSAHPIPNHKFPQSTKRKHVEDGDGKKTQDINEEAVQAKATKKAKQKAKRRRDKVRLSKG